ncbi:MAG: DUF4105 domain-containing protein [Candidatus Peribacteraceae bacterium]|jgi:hypothetical protein
MHLEKGKKRRWFETAFVVLIGWMFVRPSNDRDWSPDQAVLPSAEVRGDTVHIRNIRNFTYRTVTEYDIAYEDKDCRLSDLESLWYVVEPFSHWKGAAHAFLSFGFRGGGFMGISIEIRKEKGEKFSSLRGLFRQYELMYVIGDERDLVKLRSNYRKDSVYVYPVRAPREVIRRLFLSMVERANTLREKPEFYNTLTNTCTTNIVRHIHEFSPRRIPFSFKVLLPAYSDRLAYDLGLIDTDLTFEGARARHRINDAALLYAEHPDFSLKIREGFGTMRP